MNSKLLILILGLLLLLGSCVPIGIIIYYESLSSPTETLALAEINGSNFASFEATPGTLARFALDIHVDSTSVQEDPENMIDDYAARFKFPLSYVISGSDGAVLASEEISFDWKASGVSTSNKNVDSAGGTLDARGKTKKFEVPADGLVNIDIEISPDTTYNAVYSSPNLGLYENLIDNILYFIIVAILLLLGALMSVIGFVMLLVQAAKSVSHDEQDTEAVIHDEDARQKAMIIQVSPLLGFVIPLGSIVAPLILWLIWRDKDEYINSMGKEALNFHITMLVYFLICLILVFFIIGALLIFLVLLMELVFIIIAAIQTAKGQPFRYPLTIRFIK